MEQSSILGSLSSNYPCSGVSLTGKAIPIVIYINLSILVIQKNVPELFFVVKWLSLIVPLSLHIQTRYRPAAVSTSTDAITGTKIFATRPLFPVAAEMYYRKY